MKKFILLVLVFIGLYFAGRMLLVWSRPNSDSTDRVSIEIVKGSTLSAISEKLEEKELIRDAFVFRFYSRLNRLTTKYQAGEFVIQKNLTFKEIADVLQHGKSSEIRITIPEGSTIAQIDDILAKKSLLEAGDLIECANFCNFTFEIDSLEGHLFPSTYFVNPKTFTTKLFVSRLYNTFQQQISPIRQGIAQSGRTLNEIVIMASMIERETRLESEMAPVAGVLWKRLDERIHLGVDATTRYELNEWKRPLYTEDFEKTTPYNTRRNYGLPPTAISNPGLPAIKAAVFPEETPYYYYLHDRKGQIHFAEDLDGHVRNKQIYLN
jgi:UPF0755 protein